MVKILGKLLKASEEKPINLEELFLGSDKLMETFNKLYTSMSSIDTEFASSILSAIQYMPYLFTSNKEQPKQTAIVSLND